MKELTTEEKARSYDKAIGKAAALYKASEPMSGCNVIIETLFPELAESEQKPNGGIVREDFTQGDGWYKVNLDYLSKAQVEEIEQLVEKWNPKEVSEEEKIKKAILIYLDWLDGKKDYLPKGDYTIKDMILWLEKQGEQKFEMKTAEESLGIDSDTYNKIIDECIYGEQKPKENKGNIGEISPNWSEEDERMFNSCCAAVAAADYYTLVDKQDIENWLQSLKGRVHSKQEWSDVDKDILFRTINDLKFLRDTISIDPKYAVNIIDMEREITWLESLKDRVQPKQEWNEEDEQHIDSLLKRLDALCRNKFERTRFAISEDRDWLKSLRPQNHWKPSKEQIRALKHAFTDGSITFAEMEILATLYEGLKSFI